MNPVGENLKTEGRGVKSTEKDTRAWGVRISRDGHSLPKALDRVMYTLISCVVLTPHLSWLRIRKRVGGLLWKVGSHLLSWGGSGLHFNAAHTDHHLTMSLCSLSLEFPSITTLAPCADPSALPALTGKEDGTTHERLFFGRNGRFSAVSVKRVVLALYEDEDTKYKFHLSQSTRWICH